MDVKTVFLVFLLLLAGCESSSRKTEVVSPTKIYKLGSLSYPTRPGIYEIEGCRILATPEWAVVLPNNDQDTIVE